MFDQNLPTELWRWTGAQIAAGVRNRTISSREATESCLARTEAINPKINALMEVTPDEALQMADDADKAVAAGDALGPLHGVPFSIKCNSDQKGHATTHGTNYYKDAIAKEDAPHVANLRKAGAVFVGRSNCPAFSYRWVTSCDAHGRTLNPWSEAHSPGGSSGGAAAAVASGMVPIAHGNDIGGSIREPAFRCGLTGIRPTVGRAASWYALPEGDQVLSVQQMLVQGPIARSVEDLRISMQAFSGPDARDPVYAQVPPTGKAPGRPIKVGIVRDCKVMDPEPEVHAAIDQAAAQLRDAGYIVEETEFDDFAEAWKMWPLLVLAEFRPLMPFVREVGDQGMIKAAENYMAVGAEWWGEDPSLEMILSGYARRGTIISKLAQFLEDYPILLMPTSAVQKLEQDGDIQSVERMSRLMRSHWTLFGLPILGFPAISVPTGIVNDHPMGVQMLASRFREDLLYDAAEVIEARSGTFTPIDPKF